MLRLSALPRTLGAALRDSRNGKKDVRISAVRDLGRLASSDGRSACLDDLARVLREDLADEVRAAAAVALADAGGSEYAHVLVSASEDESVRVREMALLALGEVGSPEGRGVQHAVDKALTSAAPALRFQGLLARYRLWGRRSEPDLLNLTSDSDAHVRALAWRLIEELATNEVETSTREVLLARASEALSDPAVGVRLASAIVLTRLESGLGADVIVDVLNGSLPLPPEDEQAAIEIAGELGLHSCRPGLERRARWGWYAHPFAWHARVALARMGDGRAQRAILRGLGSWSRDTRTLAVAAAGQARLSRARPAIESMKGDPTRADPESVEVSLKLLSPQ